MSSNKRGVSSSYRLCCISPSKGQAPHFFKLNHDEILVGRNENSASLVLKSTKMPKMISRMHAKIQKKSTKECSVWTITDFSTNGVFVNDVRLPKDERRILCANDIICFGKNTPNSEFLFRFEVCDSPSQSSQSSSGPRICASKRRRMNSCDEVKQDEKSSTDQSISGDVPPSIPKVKKRSNSVLEEMNRIRNEETKKRRKEVGKLHQDMNNKISEEQEMRKALEKKYQSKLNELRKQLTSQGDDFSLTRLKLEQEQQEEIDKLKAKYEHELTALQIQRIQEADKIEADFHKQKNKQAIEFSEIRIKSDAELFKKSQEIENLRTKQDQIEVALCGKYLPGEEEARKGRKTVTFSLTPTRSTDFGNIAEQHFRYAESQFLRLGSGMKVYRVDYVVNPKLIKKFEERQRQLKTIGSHSQPILAFHGTRNANHNRILEDNFQVAMLSSNTGDEGFFGAGIYFSEYTTTAVGYNSGGDGLLLSKILIGRPYKCNDADDMLGAPLQFGYDSHISPCGQEIVIFDNAQILPCYVVYYKTDSTGRMQAF